MKWVFTSLAAVALLMACHAAEAADCVLQFDALETADGLTASVIGRGVVVLRLRGTPDEKLLQRARIIAQRLNGVATAGARPADVSVKSSRDTAQIIVAGHNVFTVNAELAKKCENSPAGLAEAWAENLKRVTAQPYLTISPCRELVVPAGEARVVKWGGSIEKPDKAGITDATVATMQVQADDRTIAVWGLQPGTTKLVISVGDCQHIIRLICKKWAAVIPTRSQLQVSGAALRRDALLRAVENLVHSVARTEPNAELNIGELVSVKGGYEVRIAAWGDGYLPTTVMHRVEVQKVAPADRPADAVLVSNLPEKVTGPGTMLRESMVGGRAVRLLWHHINLAERPLRMSVVLYNLTEEPAALHFTGAAAGPSRDEIFAGHSAAARFLLDLFSGTGFMLYVPAKASVEVAAARLRPGELASGLVQLTPYGKPNIFIEVVFEESRSRSGFFAPVPDRLYDCQITSGFEFAAEREVQLQHVVGGSWGFYTLGKTPEVNSIGRHLAGSYGVLHRINAAVENVTERPAIVELAMRPRGGVARGTFWVDGKLVETPMLDNASEQVIYKSVVDAKSTQKVVVTTVPQSGSHYPVLLTLRSWQR